MQRLRRKRRELRYSMKVTVKPYGTVNNVNYDEIFIEKENNFKVSFSDLGARINSWQVPNVQGEFESIVLGFDHAQHAFEGAGYYYGATIGRVAGRIAKGTFKLDGKTYHLPKNDGKNHLHGGDHPFDLQKWDYSINEATDKVEVIFELNDKDGANGYPGNLSVQVTHTITTDNEWIISYKAKSDERTLFNPTNHAYFNLNGNVAETIENHEIQLKADTYLPVDEANLPLGEYASVEGTAFDLRLGRKFGDLLDSDDAQFMIHQGFDHPFLLDKNKEYQGVVRVPERNRHLFFQTSEPAVVIYTQNYTPIKTKIWGENLQKYSGLTLETQKEPDAVNHSNFSSIVLEKEQMYESQTKYWLQNGSEGGK